MSRNDVNTLSQQKIQQLLAAIGTASKDTPQDDVAVMEYDWCQPRFFTLTQLEKLRLFAEDIAAGFVDEMSRLYQEKIDVSVVSSEQCFLQEFDQKLYYVTFGIDPQKPYGFLSIPQCNARAWIEQALGGGVEQPNEEEPSLSELEESMLMDVAEKLLSYFSNLYGQTLQINRRIIAPESVVLDGSKEIFRITYQLKRESDEDVGTFDILVCCDKLKSMVDQTPSEQTESKDINACLRSHIDCLPVTLRVQLGTTMLSLEQMLDLQAGDIIILDNKITEASQIKVNQKTLFQGRPAKSDGRQAVVIV